MSQTPFPIQPGAAPKTGDGLRAGPDHVAIIMDGNGRWAQARGLPRAIGHREGVEALRRAVEACRDLGLSELTVFSFSTENWKRPPQEVETLFDLLRMFVRSDLQRLHRQNVRIRIPGEREGLAGDILELIEEAVDLTAGNSGLTLNIAFNYGGRAELVDGARKLALAVREGRIRPEDIDEAMLGSTLWTAGSREPDLILRTSGEQRLSNFLLWSGAYAELMFLLVNWPDFEHRHLAEAIEAYRRRDRRFGGVGA